MLMIYKTLSVISHTLDASSPNGGALCSEEKFFFSCKKLALWESCRRQATERVLLTFS